MYARNVLLEAIRTFLYLYDWSTLHALEDTELKATNSYTESQDYECTLAASTLGETLTSSSFTTNVSFPCSYDYGTLYILPLIFRASSVNSKETNDIYDDVHAHMRDGNRSGGNESAARMEVRCGAVYTTSATFPRACITGTKKEIHSQLRTPTTNNHPYTTEYFE